MDKFFINFLIYEMMIICMTNVVNWFGLAQDHYIGTYVVFEYLHDICISLCGTCFFYNNSKHLRRYVAPSIVLGPHWLGDI